MLLTPPRGGSSLTMQELAASCGLEPDDLKELERYGLIVSRTVGGTILMCTIRSASLLAC